MGSFINDVTKNQILPDGNVTQRQTPASKNCTSFINFLYMFAENPCIKAQSSNDID